MAISGHCNRGIYLLFKYLNVNRKLFLKSMHIGEVMCVIRYEH
jgi:hypothetical protein